MNQENQENYEFLGETPLRWVIFAGAMMFIIHGWTGVIDSIKKLV